MFLSFAEIQDLQFLFLHRGIYQPGMASLRATHSLDTEPRVQDYLNDKLQTTADLNGLDTLLQNVKQQHELLQAQLEDASRILAEAETASREHDAKLQQKAEKFNERQVDIDTRLKTFTNSETSDVAVKKFESLMNKLQRLDVASSYVDLLREVDELRFVASMCKNEESTLTQMQFSGTFKAHVLPSNRYRTVPPTSIARHCC